ncbi:MAG: DUF1080 domain-containing protein [Cyclobacteriaceae bacterium]
MNTSNYLVLSLLILTMACSGSKTETKSLEESETTQEAQVEASMQNQLSEAEKADGWMLLFDGETLDGWHRFGNQEVGKLWQVVDGTLHFSGKSDDEALVNEGGDILTDGEFENYELSLQWKISPNGNSGIIYNVAETDEYDRPWKTGPEMQILDNDGHPDGKIETHRAGDLYDLIKCSEENVNPVGEWNEVKVIINDGNLQHWMNGQMVVETTMWTDEWRDMIANSKFNEYPGFGTIKKGRICLQDHNDKVWFRNIKIREL